MCERNTFLKRSAPITHQRWDVADMTPDAFAEIADGMDQMIETVVGFKAKVLAAGFSEETAEMAAAAFFQLMMRTPSGD